jgi:hypothetical protein
MAEFLAELYVPRWQGDTIAEHARAAAEAVSRSSARVRCLSSIFVPEDETCFLLYEADTLEDVEHAASRAGLTFERVALAHAIVAVKD